MKCPLKLIEWEDAFNSDHEWTKLKDAAEAIEQPFLIQTIGFEVARDEHRVTLAMSFHERSGNSTVCDLFTIPLSVIVKEQTFRRRG